MPRYRPTAIAYEESGLIQDRKAFATPNDAYTVLENAYIWRGIVKRRLGYETLGRLERSLTSQSLTASVASATYDNGGADILTTLSLRATEPNAEIESGSLTITFDTGGVNETILTDSGDGTLAITATNNLNATGGTINYITGLISVSFAVPIGAGIAVEVDFSYFPSLPVMGIIQRELNNINSEDTLFFDTKYCYLRVASTFSEFITGTAWQGDDTNFFWAINYWNSGSNRLFWVTNFNSGASGDPMRYTDGTTWTDFLPATDAAGTTFLHQALMLIPYRGRLIALNTWEGATLAGAVNYPNRVRWSQNGDPTDQVDGWKSDTQGFGGFLNAPVSEQIITAGFIRDTLIVYFERSTWKLRYTGNEILPFVWERINIELGAESTFSIVRFDKGILTVGDKAITTCDGNFVERIDQPIRDEVFKIHNGNDGVKRVHGIRNFFEQVVYWIFPSADTNPTFPNRVLLYNYDNNTWAFFRDSFTALGTFQQSSDVRWSDLTDVTWAEYEQSWIAGRLQSQFPSIVAGNAQGYVQIFNSKVGNDESLHITNIAFGTPPTITSPNHNLEDGDVVEISGIIGTSSTLNGYRYKVINAAADTFQIQRKPRYTISAINTSTGEITATGNNLAINDIIQFSEISGTTELNGRTAKVASIGNTFTIDLDISYMTAYTSGGYVENCNSPFQNVALAAGITYLGGGEITRVSNFSIKSKKFNMLDKGRKSQLGYLDILTETTSTGEISIPVYIDYNDSQPINPRDGDTHFNSAIPTTIQQFSTQNQSNEWHRFYCNVEASFFQYELTLDEPQLISKEIQESVFNLNAIIIWHEVGARLVR